MGVLYFVTGVNWISHFNKWFFLAFYPPQNTAKASTLYSSSLTRSSLICTVSQISVLSWNITIHQWFELGALDICLEAKVNTWGSLPSCMPSRVCGVWDGWPVSSQEATLAASIWSSLPGPNKEAHLRLSIFKPWRNPNVHHFLCQWQSMCSFSADLPHGKGCLQRTHGAFLWAVQGVHLLAIDYLWTLSPPCHKDPWKDCLIIRVL